MAYVGTTGASTAVNVPVLLDLSGIGHISNTYGAVIGTSTVNASSNGQSVGGGSRIWYYASVDHSSAIALTAGYFTDGGKLGMRNGDVMINVSVSSAGSTTVSMGIGVLVTTGTTGGFSYGAGGSKVAA